MTVASVCLVAGLRDCCMLSLNGIVRAVVAVVVGAVDVNEHTPRCTPDDALDFHPAGMKRPLYDRSQRGGQVPFN